MSPSWVLKQGLTVQLHLYFASEGHFLLHKAVIAALSS